MLKSIVVSLMLLLFVPATILAQSPQSAVGGDAGLFAGGEVSYFNPDYSCTSSSPFTCSNNLLGAGAVFDFNVTAKIGAEGEARWLHWNGLGNQVESDYLAGPRYRFYRRGRFGLWGKFLMGGGWITTPYYPAVGTLKGSYFVYAPGASVDYRLNRRWSLKADYEYQFWPSFAGPPTCSTTTGVCQSNNNGLTPNGFSVGILYKFLGQ